MLWIGILLTVGGLVITVLGIYLLAASSAGMH